MSHGNRDSLLIRIGQMGTEASVSPVGTVGAFATLLAWFPWKKFGYVAAGIAVRRWLIAFLMAVAMFIGYWETISNYWGDRTRPAAAASAVELGQAFRCTRHPQVDQAESDTQGKSFCCRVGGLPISVRTKGGNP